MTASTEGHDAASIAAVKTAKTEILIMVITLNDFVIVLVQKIYIVEITLGIDREVCLFLRVLFDFINLLIENEA